MKGIFCLQIAIVLFVKSTMRSYISFNKDALGCLYGWKRLMSFIHFSFREQAFTVVSALHFIHVWWSQYEALGWIPQFRAQSSIPWLPTMHRSISRDSHEYILQWTPIGHVMYEHLPWCTPVWSVLNKHFMTLYEHFMTLYEHFVHFLSVSLYGSLLPVSPLIRSSRL